MQTWMIEGIGYIASGLIALSLLMVSVVKLRIINLMGSTAFVVYGGLIGSVPLVITNTFIIGVNCMHLYRLRSRNHGVQYMEMGGDHRVQVEDFAHACFSDIHRFFPRFSVQQIAAAERSGGRIFAAMRHLKVVGFAVVFPATAAEQVLDHTETALLQSGAPRIRPHLELCFLIDYILPRYRGIGLVQGLHELVIHHSGSESTALFAFADQRSRRHAAFLRHSGFSVLGEKDGVLLYRKPLGAYNADPHTSAD